MSAIGFLTLDGWRYLVDTLTQSLTTTKNCKCMKLTFDGKVVQQ